MNIETSGIPNLHLEKSGNKKNPFYTLKKNKVVTNGRIELWIEHDMATDGSFYIPQEQVNAYFYLVENQERMKQSILEALKKQFPRLLSDEYASWDHEDPGMPRLSD